MRTRLHGAILAAGALIAAAPALAQNPQVPLRGQDTAPNLPPQNETIPEKVRPGGPSAAPDTTGSTLSDQLKSSDGVIRPSTGTSPDNTVRPPVPEPNSTPVIKPGELPGQGPNTRAK